MRVSLRRFALALSLPAITAAPALAEQYYYDDGQPPAAIALFSGQGFTGDVREAFDPFASMHDMAFNDRARSVAVLAGQWELCEHHNFTGRCVFIREDVPDLGWFGLNNQVSSIRPIFEYTEAQHGLMFSRDDYGYIRYAHNESYGHGHWNYGYASSVRISVQHYGYSPDYWRFGYYDPRWGYDPYGFAWSPFGGPRYVSYVYRVHPRPVIINNYWKKSWSSNHKHWNRRGHRDDWRRSVDWRGGNDGRGRGGSSSRDDRGRGGSDGRGRGTDWNRDDRGRGGNDGRWAGGGGRDGNRDGTSRGGNRSGQDSARRTDERDLARTPGQRGPRGDGQRTDGRGPARADSGVIPADPRRGSGNWQGNRGGNTSATGAPRGDGQRRGGGERTAGSFTPPSTPQATVSPSPRISTPGGSSSPQRDRPNRDGNRGDGGRRGGDTLLGAPGGTPSAASTPRGGGQGSGNWQGNRGGNTSAASPPRSERPSGGGGGASRGPSSAPASAPAARPSPPPQTAVSRPSPPPRVEGGRGRGGGDGGGRGGRRSGSAQD